ncbi:MAG: hypothetical protein BGO11_21365 [Solirubrobacterales bacterium 70-9]|nr:MAG: hypothetical protein BGO11_21365 [Solirubrobacterales bacterium 70-9]
MIFAGTSLLLLLVLGAPSIWSGLYVLVSGLFAAAVLYIAHTHRGARVGLPTRGETRNGLATNVAILLAVLQLASGMFGLTKEIEARASARGPTTIIEQQVCPPSSHFEFPYERS